MLDERVFPWYALKIRCNFEQTVAASLRGKGFEPFLPLYLESRRWSDRIKTLSRPLFPGYVFCRLDARDRMPVLTTPGVANIVGIGKCPVPVPDQEMANIQAMVNSELFAQPWPFLRVGEKIRVESGPLTGVEGLLVAIKGNYRLIASIEMLQRSIAVEIDREWIRPIEDKAVVPEPARTYC